MLYVVKIYKVNGLLNAVKIYCQAAYTDTHLHIHALTVIGTHAGNDVCRKCKSHESR